MLVSKAGLSYTSRDIAMGGTVTIPGTVTKARSLVADQELDVVTAEESSTLLVPPLGLYDVIVVSRNG
jgi:hypothetical protein